MNVMKHIHRGHPTRLPASEIEANAAARRRRVRLRRSKHSAGVRAMRRSCK